jgi:riboflavin synthase
MFTGIIEERGRISGWERTPDGGARLTIDAPLVTEDAGHGDSIAVSGVCLTVVAFGDGRFTADVMGQTLAVSAIADLGEGEVVTLERAALVGDRLGGHIVQGHVDGVGEVLQVRDEGSWRVLRFSLPDDLAPLVVDKGSIAVAGTSLTVSSVGAWAPEAGSGATPQAAGRPWVRDWFEVSLIPETLTATTLGGLAVGDRVNLETDVLARHVQRLLATTQVKEGVA